MIRVAVDAMGGDFAPEETVKGACQAVKLDPGLEVILVGPEDRLLKLLKKYDPPRISVKQASQVIGMDESPVSAVREKKDSSINIACQLLKDGQAEALVSAGNTGAFMAAALFKLGRIPGVERPAIATIFPTGTGKVLLLDMGANSDNRPQHLKQFGEMGSIFAEKVLHLPNPRVGLLNIGEEPEKGNELTRATYPLMKSSKINFIGMVESKEILSGKVDVVVCDGFVGNLILKFGESLASFVIDMLKKELFKNIFTMLAALLLVPAFRSLRKRLDFNEMGGAPILGVDGICFKAHGRSKAKAIMNAIRAAAEAVRGDMLNIIKAVEAQ